MGDTIVRGRQQVVYLIVNAILFVMIPPIGRRCLGRRDRANNELGVENQGGAEPQHRPIRNPKAPHVWSALNSFWIRTSIMKLSTQQSFILYRERFLSADVCIKKKDLADGLSGIYEWCFVTPRETVLPGAGCIHVLTVLTFFFTLFIPVRVYRQVEGN